MFKTKALTEAQERELVALYHLGYTHKELGIKFNICARTAGDYVRRNKANERTLATAGTAFRRLADDTGFKESYLRSACLVILSNEPVLLRNILEEVLELPAKYARVKRNPDEKR